jgi:hypothetical protein
MRKEPITISFNTFDNHISKVLGALDNPNDITIHSYNQFLVLNVVFHSPPLSS